MSEFSLTAAESVFTAEFNREAFYGESGPAMVWLKDYELDPALMVAFQWALESKPSLQRHSLDRSASSAFVVPWQTADAMRTRVAEIVAGYPWLAPYAKDATPGLVAQDHDEGTVGQIPMYRLIRGTWYVGRGRNGNVGLWNGQNFLVIGEKFGGHVIKEEPYFVTASGCFQPFREIDEGQVSQPLGRVGWDAHFGHRMKFGHTEVSEVNG
jgi:hypothetical protein